MWPGISEVYEQLLLALVNTHLNGDDDFSEVLGELLEEDEGSYTSTIEELKEQGNSLFKESTFGGASVFYDKAIKLLCMTQPMNKKHETSLQKLALTLNLNLAACAIKLGKFEEANVLCSLVLHFEPNNVKALFRRALACVELGILDKAFMDLSMALVLDPKNKEVLREVNKLKLRTSVIGEEMEVRKVDGPLRTDDPCGRENNHGDMPPSAVVVEPLMTLVVEKEEMSTDMDLGETYLVERDGMVDEETVTITLAPEESTSTKLLECSDDPMDSSTGCQKEKIFEFSKKRGHSRLRIPASVYQKMSKGKTISFCQSQQSSYMQVRTVNQYDSNPKNGKETRIIPPGKESSITMPLSEVKAVNRVDSPTVDVVGHTSVSGELDRNLPQNPSKCFVTEARYPLSTQGGRDGTDAGWNMATTLILSRVATGNQYLKKQKIGHKRKQCPVLTTTQATATTWKHHACIPSILSGRKVIGCIRSGKRAQMQYSGVNLARIRTLLSPGLKPLKRQGKFLLRFYNVSLCCRGSSHVSTNKAKRKQETSWDKSSCTLCKRQRLLKDLWRLPNSSSSFSMLINFPIVFTLNVNVKGSESLVLCRSNKG